MNDRLTPASQEAPASPAAEPEGMKPTEDLKRVYQAYLDNEAASPSPGLREAVIEECAQTIEGFDHFQNEQEQYVKMALASILRALSRPVSEREGDAE